MEQANLSFDVQRFAFKGSDKFSSSSNGCVNNLIIGRLFYTHFFVCVKVFEYKTVYLTEPLSYSGCLRIVGDVFY